MADISREEILFDFQAETAAAQAKVERYTQAIEKARASGKRVGLDLKNGLAQAQKQVTATTREMRKFEQASRRAAGGSTFLYQQLGYLASDARYGLLGVANNLSIVAVGLQNMQQRAKELGTTFSKSFVRGLWGPGGVLLAIQVLIALLPELLKYFKGLSSETESWTTNVDKNVVQLHLFEAQLKRGNLTLKERNNLMKQAKALGVEDGNFEAARERFQKKMALVQKEQELIALYKEKYQGPGFWRKVWMGLSTVFGKNGFKNAMRMMMGLPALPEDIASEWDKWQNNIDKRIKKVSGEALDLMDFSKSKGDDKPTLFETLWKGLTGETDAFAEKMQQNSESLLETAQRHYQDDLSLYQSYLLQKKISFDEYTDLVAQRNVKFANDQQDIAKAQDEADKAFKQAALDRLSGYLNNAAQLNRKWAGLSAAATLISGTRAAVGAWKDWKEKGPFGPIGNTIGAVAETAVIGGITAASVHKILSAGNGNVSASSASSGGGRPSFNIIGQNSNNALQETIQQQTGVIQDQQKDQRVVLVQSDLQIKDNDQRVAMETSTF